MACENIQLYAGLEYGIEGAAHTMGEKGRKIIECVTWDTEEGGGGLEL